MEVKIIEELTLRWHTIVWSVIGLAHPDIPKLRSLLHETCNLLDQYSREDQVPKKLSALLLEVQSFSWWISTLESSPLYKRHQEIVTLVEMLTGFFLERDTDRQQIESLINQL